MLLLGPLLDTARFLVVVLQLMLLTLLLLAAAAAVAEAANMLLNWASDDYFSSVFVSSNT